MFTEILKIIPQIASGDLSRMEALLNARFVRIAKKFGGGLMSVMKGGGVAGAALALIDKILNPLKETQEAIDRTLSKADDLVTAAGQFNTTAGKLAKLQAFGKATGLDADSLSMLITKFQTAVADAKADPTKKSAVSNFTKNTDTAESFFQFIQSLQKMDKNQQVRVQSEVFGEKQILKMSDFLQTDFNKLNAYFSKFEAGKLDAAAGKLGNLKDLDDTLAAVRDLEDMQKKSAVINKGMVLSKDNAERLQLERENMRIKSYEDLRKITGAVDQIMIMIEQGLAMLGKLIGVLTPMVGQIEKMFQAMKTSRFFKFFGGN